MVQKFGDPLELTNVNFEFEFYNKNNALQIQKITGVKRKWEEIEDDTSDLRTISQFLDKGSIDNSFDVIECDNEEEFSNNHSKTTIKYRNLKKKPILIIYPVKYNDLIFPLFYFVIPSIDGGKKVQYLVRNNRS